MKFAFISEEKVAFPVAVLCRLLAVSPSGYYATHGRPRSLHARRDDKLAEQVVEAHAASKGRYGSPRVHAELKAAGERVGRKRVARLMREKKLAARTRRRFRTTTDSKHDFPIAPNVLERDFTASAPDRAWVTDITFVWTAQGWLYLAVILDLFSRRVVGWATSQNVDRHLALAALDTALARRHPAAGLVHHSDRGSTYASSDYRKALDARGLKCSMSRKGDCWDSRRELLLDAQARARRNRWWLREPRRCRAVDRRLYRRLLQHPTPPLRDQLHQPRRVRADTFRAESSSVTKPSIRSGQPHFSLRGSRVRAAPLSWSTETTSAT